MLATGCPFHIFIIYEPCPCFEALYLDESPAGVVGLQVKSLEKKASKQAALQAAQKEVFNSCLVAPFIDAAIGGRTRSCTALTKSWLAYLGHIQVLQRLLFRNFVALSEQWEAAALPVPPLILQFLNILYRGRLHIAVLSIRLASRTLIAVNSNIALLLQSEDAADEEAVVGLAARALEMLASVATAATAATAVPAEDGEPELGSFLAGGEMPHAQACVLYILRVGVIERLGETGQVRCSGSAP